MNDAEGRSARAHHGTRRRDDARATALEALELFREADNATGIALAFLPPEVGEGSEVAIDVRGDGIDGTVRFDLYNTRDAAGERASELTLLVGMAGMILNLASAFYCAVFTKGAENAFRYSIGLEVFRERMQGWLNSCCIWNCLNSSRE